MREENPREQPGEDLDPGPDVVVADAGQQIQRRAEEVVDVAIAWIEEDPETPFFAWVHFANLAYIHPGPRKTPENVEMADTAYAENLAAIDDIGGPKYFNHYPWGWTWAGNTPFRRWKRETYRGGISDPFIVHWPAGLQDKGEVRDQYAHAIDMVPTVLDLLGIEPPTFIRGVQQSPIEGLSLAGSLADPDAPSRRTTQYFEMLGHRSIYHDGWKAVCPWPGTSFAVVSVSSVTMVGPSAGVICKPVDSVSPLKCRYFVSTLSSIARSGVSAAGQSPSLGTPWTVSPALVMSGKVLSRTSG